MAIQVLDDPLPIPPFEMRQLVGPTDEAAFDDPSGDPILQLPESQFQFRARFWLRLRTARAADDAAASPAATVRRIRPAL
jgi:hypothetical protein